MLSVSARGNALNAAQYYEHLQTDARGHVLEDYYADGVTGYYAGSGADTLGLKGGVVADEFYDLAAGGTPIGGVQGAGEGHRAGWDLTWSAPKSISIAWALSDDKTRADIQAAHDQAVAAGVRFIEDHAAVTRRGSGSKFSDLERREKVGLVIACYRHATSREQDPQLHTHAFVFNVAPRQDGSVGTLDSRPLYEWRVAAGTVYQAELAREMRKLDFEVERDGKNTIRLQDIPKELETEFSTRRQQIEAALKARGTQGAKASEVATLATRKSKQDCSREALMDRWQNRAKTIAPEWSPETARGKPRSLQQTVALDATEIMRQGTEQRSTLTEAQLYAATAAARLLSDDWEGIEASTQVVKHDADTVTLEDRGHERYTTQEMLSIEQQMVARAQDMSNAKHHGVSREHIDAALRARSELSTEQKDAVEHITYENDLACIQGWAGTGKSFTLGAAREVWEAEGYRVRGATLSGKAAQELQSGSGIASTTLKRLEMDARGYVDEQDRFHEPTDELTEKDILILDEAGMVGSRQMSRLLEDAERGGAKVVLVGDTRQLQALEAGAAFRAIQERVGYVELGDIRRQHRAEDREAVRDLAEGRAEKALENLAHRDRVHAYDRAFDAKQAVGRAVVADIEAGKLSLALAATRDEVRDINEHARLAAREHDLLQGADVPVLTHAGERNISTGDRLLFTRNSRDLNVKNGDLATLQTIEAREHGQARLTLALDRGGERRVDTREYDHLELGYAVTVHKAQGSTVDRAHVYAAENGLTAREWAYVAASRHRDEVHIHAERSVLADLAPEWARSRQKDVTLDYKGVPEHENQRAQKRSISPNEIDHSLGH